MRQHLIDFLKELEKRVPPPPFCHHAITFAQYGSDEEGWEDRLALQLNLGGAFHCFFLDDSDLAGSPGVLIEHLITMLVLKNGFTWQLGRGPGQYTGEN